MKKSEDNISQRPISAESKRETPDAFVDSSPADLSQQQASPQEIPNKEELGSSSSSTKESLQQTTVTPVSPDSVQSSLIEEQKAITSAKEPASDTKNVAEELRISVDDVEQQTKTGISDEKHAKQLSTASEILTVSPVPIQVAESVLQVEPKESALDSQAMPQQVLSSTITPVHLTEVEDKLRMNGSTQSEEKLSSASAAAAAESVIDNNAGKLSEPSEAKGTSQILLPVEQVETAALSLESSETPEESSEKQATETVEEIESSRKESVESIESSQSECEKSKTSSSSSSGKTPVRPTRAKELGTPSTTVPKAAQQTPKGQEKAIKKTVKKSAEKSAAEGGEATEAADGDGNEKKVAKKVVKKVAKKTKSKSEEGLDDGAEDSSSAVKQKKTVKVVKKGTKSSQAAATDAAVPETPSSSASDTPVPPKRKTKATAAKSAAKKSDTEQ